MSSLPELLWYGEGAILADSSNSSQEEALVLTVESDKEEQGVAGEVDTAAAAESIDPPRAGNPLSARAGATPPAGYCAPVLHCRVLQCSSATALPACCSSLALETGTMVETGGGEMLRKVMRERITVCWERRMTTQRNKRELL